MNNRDIAKLLGRATYNGGACRLGHTVKLTRNMRCAECEELQLVLPKKDRVKRVGISKPQTPEQKAKTRAYYLKNKAKLDAYRTEWYAKNKAMRNEYMKEWRRRNLDKPYYSSRAKPKDKI